MAFLVNLYTAWLDMKLYVTLYMYQWAKCVVVLAWTHCTQLRPWHTIHCTGLTLYECGLWYIGLPGSSFFDTSTEQALVDLFWTHSLEKIQVLVLNSYNIDLTKLNATIKYLTHTMSFCTKTTDLFHKIILLCCFLNNWWKLFWCGLNLSGIYCDLSGAGYELRV